MSVKMSPPMDVIFELQRGATASTSIDKKLEMEYNNHEFTIGIDLENIASKVVDRMFLN